MTEQMSIPKFKGRVEFLNHLEFISKQVAKGECYKNIHQSLKQDGQIKMSYSTFLAYARSVFQNIKPLKPINTPQKKHAEKVQQQQLTSPPAGDGSPSKSSAENTPTKNFKIHVAAPVNQPDTSPPDRPLPVEDNLEVKTFKFNKLPDVNDLLK